MTFSDVFLNVPDETLDGGMWYKKSVGPISLILLTGLPVSGFWTAAKENK